MVFCYGTWETSTKRSHLIKKRNVHSLWRVPENFRGWKTYLLLPLSLSLSLPHTHTHAHPHKHTLAHHSNPQLQPGIEDQSSQREPQVYGFPFLQHLPQMQALQAPHLAKGITCQQRPLLGGIARAPRCRELTQSAAADRDTERSSFITSQQAFVKFTISCVPSS